MPLVSRRLMLGGTAALAVTATLAACSHDSSGADSDGDVYFLNFKPESEQAFKEIATAYKDKTGVNVKVVTAASGNYEQTLKAEVVKSNLPTLFNINGPMGYANWVDGGPGKPEDDGAPGDQAQEEGGVHEEQVLDAATQVVGQADDDGEDHGGGAHDRGAPVSR